jgi:methylated-DNA-[protein]-cysteine S-methyltransferase
MCRTLIYRIEHMKNTDAAQLFCIRPSPFGPVAVLWSVHEGRPKIWQVILSKSGFSSVQAVAAASGEFIPASCAVIDAAADDISAFLHGDDVRISLDMIRLDRCSDFQAKVLRAEYGIPRGCVSTYQRIAHHTGTPAGARAVGTALARNPFPVVIPCHRALRTDLTLGGYQGGLAMKRALLEAEGVEFDDAGRVVPEHMFY